MSVKLMRLVGCVAVVAMLLLPATALAAPPVQGDTWHVVVAGETLSWIAARYGVSISELVLANGLRDANAIYAGQRLLIPRSGGPAVAPREHIVDAGESLTSVASLYGISVGQLAAANGLSNTDFIFIGQVLSIPAASQPPFGAGYGCMNSHTVQPGDTLTNIGARYGVSVAALMRSNALRSDVIYSGQRLCVPSDAVDAVPGAQVPSAPEAYPAPAYQQPAYQPGYQPPAYQPGYQPPANQPVYQPPAYQPGYQPPANQPVYQPPAYQPGYQPPAYQPGYQPPANQPVYQPPAYQPGYQAPTAQPAYQQPVYQPPAYQLCASAPCPTVPGSIGPMVQATEYAPSTDVGVTVVRATEVWLGNQTADPLDPQGRTTLMVMVWDGKGVPVIMRDVNGAEMRRVASVNFEFSWVPTAVYRDIAPGLYDVFVEGQPTRIARAEVHGGHRPLIEFRKKQATPEMGAVVATASGTNWVANVIENTSGEKPLGVASILVVKTGMNDQVIRVKAAPSFETTCTTGSKPEHGPGACDIGGLSAGTYQVILDGAGVGIEIFLDGLGTATVEFHPE